LLSENKVSSFEYDAGTNNPADVYRITYPGATIPGQSSRGIYEQVPENFGVHSSIVNPVITVLEDSVEPARTEVYTGVSNQHHPVETV